MGMLASLALVVGLASAGCGGDDTSDEGEASVVQSLRDDADALASCLEGADLDARVNDATPFGVEDETVGVEIDDLSDDSLVNDFGSDDGNGADLWLFETAERAEGNQMAITLETDDNDKNWVSGRVVVRMFYPSDRTSPEIEAMQECVDAVG